MPLPLGFAHLARSCALFGHCIPFALLAVQCPSPFVIRVATESTQSRGAPADGVGVVSQRLIPTGERSGLQMHIAATVITSLWLNILRQYVPAEQQVTGNIEVFDLRAFCLGIAFLNPLT
jgi:hypothetical protein